MEVLENSITKLIFKVLNDRYNTFSGYPPEIVKKMPKKDLAEEVISSP